MRADVILAPVDPRSPDVAALLDALTAELAASGYTDDETFGYSVEQLRANGVHLVGARVAGVLVGLGGIELARNGAGPDGADPAGPAAELKRFYVLPEHRGAGVADTVLAALLDHAADAGVRVVRLETGDKQAAAIAFYRRHGFAQIPRFGAYVDSATSVCMQRSLG